MSKRNSLEDPLDEDPYAELESGNHGTSNRESFNGGGGGGGEPYSVYSPQVYPHLMPQNFLQAQKRMPRSSSGGSVLV